MSRSINASGVQLDFHDLDKDIANVLNEYPDETLSFMRKEANKWKKDCNDKGYKAYTGQKRPIPKNWKTTKEENVLHQATAIEIQNKSPLFHLLENGHVKVLWGKRTNGFVPGKHWAEKTRAEWQETFPQEVEEYINTMLGRHKL